MDSPRACCSSAAGPAESVAVAGPIGGPDVVEGEPTGDSAYLVMPMRLRRGSRGPLVRRVSSSATILGVLKGRGCRWCGMKWGTCACLSSISMGSVLCLSTSRSYNPCGTSARGAGLGRLLRTAGRRCCRLQLSSTASRAPTAPSALRPALALPAALLLSPLPLPCAAPMKLFGCLAARFQPLGRCPPWGEDMSRECVSGREDSVMRCGRLG
mmetsp:Transcript_20499/g.44821  ORF Transcript_20499/g.44821 Transcript_20499/m.44821 type:complete len:212 (+) Transcript_20499:918-1553(+)